MYVNFVVVRVWDINDIHNRREVGHFEGSYEANIYAQAVAKKLAGDIAYLDNPCTYFESWKDGKFGYITEGDLVIYQVMSVEEGYRLEETH